MRFHPKKCKVVSIGHKHKTLSVLPFYNYPYYVIGGELLDFCDSEKDLGILVQEKIN
jgi:hypothetical protein